MNSDYYKILNVPPTASQQQIKQAYVKLIKQFHPDKNPKDPQSDERTKSINEAYAVLKDRQQRRQYDLTRERGQRADGAVPNGYDAGEQSFFNHLHATMRCKKNPRALKNMALYAFNRGDYSLAGSLLEQGIRVSPEDSELYLGLSWCMYHQGHYSQCVRVLEKLLALNPKNIDVWFNLAWLQEIDGDLDGALKSLQTAQAHFPNTVELKSRMAEIEKKLNGPAPSLSSDDRNPELKDPEKNTPFNS
jgi:curved DNA-binding protein CbpA